MTTVPAWYATETAHCLREVWRQGVDDKTLARAYNAYLAAAPSADDYPTPAQPVPYRDDLLTAACHFPAEETA